MQIFSQPTVQLFAISFFTALLAVPRAALVQRFDHLGREINVKTGQSTQHKMSFSNYFATLELPTCHCVIVTQYEMLRSAPPPYTRDSNQIPKVQQEYSVKQYPAKKLVFTLEIFAVHTMLV